MNFKKNKTFLLILDDEWTEDHNEWSKLRRYLTIGGRGSRVVITTRSETTVEIIVAACPSNNLSPQIRHICLDEEEWAQTSFHETKIRTCFMNSRFPLDMVNYLVANCRSLRSLRLYVPNAESLLDSIGELLHLRYLDLSRNVKLKTLPNSIAKLYNLQSLIMVGCSNWKAWPINFYELVNLRLLDIHECPELTYMPLGIGQLTNLRDLTNFKVGTPSSIGDQFGGELKDVKSLVNLRGELDIRIFKDSVSHRENVWEGGYWEHIKNLKVLAIHFNAKAHTTDNEALFAKLQPNRNLMKLSLYGYNGTEIPRWGRAHDNWAIILPYLVKIELEGIERLQGIPLLSNWKHLKFLSLFMSNNLEYMETRAISRGCSGSKDITFFPSLEHLSIWCLKRLKGWWGAAAEGYNSRGRPHWQPSFPRLSTLIINSCPELTSFPPSPSLELLRGN
ncbi:hypothetical protein KSS87_012604 [Heliosperma pusillum]|nr:hypothetical protein KSS87_012604 [Heliosperma pusillum]